MRNYVCNYIVISYREREEGRGFEGGGVGNGRRGHREVLGNEGRVIN